MSKLISTRAKVALLCLPIFLMVATVLFIRLETLRLMQSLRGSRDLRQAVSRYQSAIPGRPLGVREIRGPLWFRPNAIEVDGPTYTYTVVRNSNRWRVAGHRVNGVFQVPIAATKPGTGESEELTIGDTLKTQKLTPQEQRNLKANLVIQRKTLRPVSKRDYQEIKKHWNHPDFRWRRPDFSLRSRYHKATHILSVTVNYKGEMPY
ncbi:MAG TPA: hypothetical protein VF600_05775 [Abditibacteriaceae bacterium]